MSTLSTQGVALRHIVRADPPVPDKLSDIITRVLQVAEQQTVTVGEVIQAVGRASFAPILLLPALAVATPLSGIPLFSSLMGMVICLVSIQMLLRRDRVWLPRWILRRQVKGQRVAQAFAYIRPVARWLDDKTGKRFRIVVRRPLIFLPQLLCFLSGLCMPVLEFIPFSSSIMGAGVACLALGMLTKDGLVILIGLIPYAIVGWFVIV